MKLSILQYLLAIIWILTGEYFIIISCSTIWYYSEPFIMFYGMIPERLPIIHLYVGMTSFVLGLELAQPTPSLLHKLRSLALILIVLEALSVDTIIDHPEWFLEVVAVFPLILITALSYLRSKRFAAFFKSFTYQNKGKRLVFDIAIIAIICLIQSMFHYKNLWLLHRLH